jgi:hypothetical protein
MIKEFITDTNDDIQYQMFCDNCNSQYNHHTGENTTSWLTKPNGFVESAINNGWKIDHENPSSIICNKCNKIELNLGNETLMKYLLKNCKEVIKVDENPQIGPAVKLHLYTLNDIIIMMYVEQSYTNYHINRGPKARPINEKQSTLFFNNRLGHLTTDFEYNQNKKDFIEVTGFNLGGLTSTPVFENSANINDDSRTIRYYLNYFL